MSRPRSWRTRTLADVGSAQEKAALLSRAELGDDDVERARLARQLADELDREDELARLIKRATKGRGWCSTPPLAIARYLLAQGVTLPTQKEVKR